MALVSAAGFGDGTSYLIATKEGRMRWRRRENRVHGNRQIIDHGTVWCPVSRVNLDVDRCWECDAFQGVVDREDVAVLHCQPWALAYRQTIPL